MVYFVLPGVKVMVDVDVIGFESYFRSKHHEYVIVRDAKTKQLLRLELPTPAWANNDELRAFVAAQTGANKEKVKIPKRIAATLAARLRETSQPKGEKET